MPLHFLELRIENAGDDQKATRLNEVQNSPGLGYQQIGQKVGADDIMLCPSLKGHFGEISSPELHAV